MADRSGIYCIENKISNKKYIGQSQYLRKRLTRHKNMLITGTHDNIHIQNSWDKYGKEAFKFSILEYCEVAKLNEREEYYICKFDTFKNGFNRTLGGGGIRGYSLSNEQKEKLSKKYKGENNPFYGKTHDLKTKEMLSKIHKQRALEGKHNRLGKKLSEETKRLIGSYHKGKTISQEQRKKHSEMFSGKKHPSSVRVICLTTGEVFQYMGEASEKYNLDRSNLTKCCKGKTKWCGIHPATGEKLKWMYKEDYDKYIEEQNKELALT